MAYDLGVNPMSAFEIGQQAAAGQNPVGEMIKNVVAQANQMNLLKAKSQYDIQSQIAAAGPVAAAKAKAELEYDPFFGTKGVSSQGLLGQPQGQDLASKINYVRNQLPAGAKYTRGGLTIESSERLPASQRPPPQTQLDAYRGIEESIRRLEELKSMQAKGNFQTGPMSGRFYRNPFGNAVLQYAGTPEESQFMRLSNQFQDIYRRSVTGAQAGFPEIRFLTSSIPNPGAEVPEKYRASIDATLGELYSNRDLMRNILQSSGYKVPSMVFGNQNTTPSPSAGQGNYVRTGVDKSTGRRVGQLPDGTLEYIQ